MYGMHIINGVHGQELRSSERNTSPKPQVSALIPWLIFNGMERISQRHGVIITSILLFWSENHYVINLYIATCRGVFGINHFKLRNLLSLQYNVFATAVRGSIMARIHGWSVMIYDSLQAGFMDTKYNSHIHMYGTYIFGKFVINISKPINNNSQIFWRL